MTKLVDVDYGQAGWDKSIQANFAALNQDSGWIDSPIIAPVTGNLAYRVKGDIMYIRGLVMPNQTIGSNDLVCGYIPTNFLPGLVKIQGYALWIIPVAGKNTDLAKIVLGTSGEVSIVSDGSALSTQPVIINISFTIN